MTEGGFLIEREGVVARPGLKPLLFLRLIPRAEARGFLRCAAARHRVRGGGSLDGGTGGLKPVILGRSADGSPETRPAGLRLRVREREKQPQILRRGAPQDDRGRVAALLRMTEGGSRR